MKLSYIIIIIATVGIYFLWRNKKKTEDNFDYDSFIFPPVLGFPI